MAAEDGVGLDRDVNVQIPWRRGALASFTLPGDANSLAFVNAGGNLHRDRLLLQLPTCSATTRAMIANNRSTAAAIRAGCDHPKHPAEALLRNASLPAALSTDRGAAARFGAGATAFVAAVLLFKFDCFFDAGCNFLKGELDLSLQIEAARGAGARGSSPAVKASEGAA